LVVHGGGRTRPLKRRQASNIVVLVQEKTHKSLSLSLESIDSKKNMYRIAEQIAKSRSDVVSVN